MANDKFYPKILGLSVSKKDKEEIKMEAKILELLMMDQLLSNTNRIISLLEEIEENTSNDIQEIQDNLEDIKKNIREIKEDTRDIRFR